MSLNISSHALYCYSIWLRHLVLASKYGQDTDPRVVVELGPGQTLGTGIAALLTGADEYVGCDAVPQADTQSVEKLCAELLHLFNDRTDIPFPEMNPQLSSYEFPEHILTDERLRRCLDPTRISKLSSGLRYIAPWTESSVSEGSAGMVFSQAAMSYPADIQRVYTAIRRWLGPRGYMSHQIPYNAMSTSITSWNGHLAYSDLAWRIVCGRSRYSLNRISHTGHLTAMRAAGFQIIGTEVVEDDTGLVANRLAPRYRTLPENDLKISRAFIVAAPSHH